MSFTTSIRALTWTLVSTCACSWPPPFPVVADAQFVLLAFDFNDTREVALYGVEPDDFQVEINQPTSDQTVVSALFYRETSELLQIPLGKIEASESGRRVPAPARIFAAPRSEPWIETATLSARITDLRVPEFSDAVCLDAGGCTWGDEARCTVSCDPPLPEAPKVPSPPSGPSWAVAPCVSSSEARTLLNEAWCAPLEATRCPQGTRYQIDTGACVRVGRECPPGWPDSAPMDAIYVDANASPGGDGSRVAPFSQFPAVRTSSVVVVRGGARIDVPTLRDVTVIGACPERVLVTNVVLGGTVVLRDLELTSSTLEAGAELTLDGVWFDAGRMQMTGGANVHFEQVWSRSPIVVDGSILSIANSSLDDIFVEDSQLDIEASIVQSADRNSVRAISSTVTVEKTILLGGTPLYSRNSKASLTDCVIGALDAQKGTLEVSGGELTLASSFVVSSHPESELRITNCEVTFSDVRVQLGGPTNVGLQGSSLHAIRFVIDAPINALGMSSGTAVLEDVRVRSPGVALGFGDATSIVVKRAQIDAGAAFSAQASPMAHLEDIGVEHRGFQNLDAIAFNSIPVALRRIAVRGMNHTPNPAVSFTDADATIEDLDVRGVTDGLRLLKTTLDVVRFSISDNLVGVRVLRGSSATFSEGIVRDNELGLAIESPVPSPTFREVLFLDNAVRESTTSP